MVSSGRRSSRLTEPPSTPCWRVGGAIGCRGRWWTGFMLRREPAVCVGHRARARGSSRPRRGAADPADTGRRALPAPERGGWSRPMSLCWRSRRRRRRHWRSCRPRPMTSCCRTWMPRLRVRSSRSPAIACGSTHPLLASTHYAAASAAQRRAMHRRLAGVVDDPQQRARHLALGAEAASRTIATAIEQGANVAAGRGAPDIAAELLEDAARLTPVDAAEARHLRLIRAAELHERAGRRRPQPGPAERGSPCSSSGPLRRAPSSV